VLVALAGCSSAGSAPAPASNDAGCDLGALAATLSPPAPNCPNDLPARDDCGSAAPSYQAVIASVVHERCGGCHVPGAGNRYVFATYAEVAVARERMLTQVYACRMPPSCVPPLLPSERSALLKWLVCGAPDN